MARPFGSKNIPNCTVRELILKNGYNPIQDMIDQLQHCTKGQQRFDCAEKLARYLYPTMKSIELTGQEGGAIEILSRIIVLPAKEINAPTE